jgi:hypothetical protein
MLGDETTIDERVQAPIRVLSHVTNAALTLRDYASMSAQVAAYRAI